MAEQQVINEIREYKRQLELTSSTQRKTQLIRHIRKLDKELKTYRMLRKAQYERNFN